MSSQRFDDFADRIYRLARSMGCSEDAAQEALLKEWQARRFNPDRPDGQGYAPTVLRNCSADEFRKRRPGLLPAGYDKASPEPPADQVASFAEFRERVRAALAELPERERKVIEGKIAGESVEEIADHLCVTVREVYALTFKARVKLREALG